MMHMKLKKNEDTDLTSQSGLSLLFCSDIIKLRISKALVFALCRIYVPFKGACVCISYDIFVLASR